MKVCASNLKICPGEHLQIVYTWPMDLHDENSKVLTGIYSKVPTLVAFQLQKVVSFPR